jgi:hypothetical protein
MKNARMVKLTTDCPAQSLAATRQLKPLPAPFDSSGRALSEAEWELTRISTDFRGFNILHKMLFYDELEVVSADYRRQAVLPFAREM